MSNETDAVAVTDWPVPPDRRLDEVNLLATPPTLYRIDWTMMNDNPSGQTGA